MATLLPKVGSSQGEQRIAFHKVLPNRVRPAGQIAVRDGKYLLVANPILISKFELYDYVRDPLEIYDLAGTDEGRKAIRRLLPHLTSELTRWAGDSVARTSAITADEKARLRSLGYLGTGASYESQQTGTQQITPALTARYRSAITENWSADAAETHDDLFPTRLLVSQSERLYIIENTAHQLRRIYDSVDAAPQTRSEPYHDPSFQRVRFAATVQHDDLLALFDGKRLERLFPNEHPDSFRAKIVTFGKSFDDIAYVEGLGVLLFSREGIFVWNGTGKERLLTELTSEPTRVAWSQKRSKLYVGHGGFIVEVTSGKKPVVFHEFKLEVLSLALRGDQLWVGLPPAPAGLKAMEPILVMDCDSGKVLGSLGRRYSDETSSWGAPALEVGVFGINYPAQLIFSGNTLRVVDSYLERILSFEIGT